MFHLTPINHLLDTSSKEEATLDTVFLQNNPRFLGFIQILNFQSDQTFWITLYFLAQVPEAPV